MARRSKALSFLTWLPQAALIGLARALPYRARLAFASGFARAARRRSFPASAAGSRATSASSSPTCPPAERRRIRSAMADSFGRTMIEVMTRRAFQARRAWTGPTGPGWDALQAARAEGRGALLVSGHFGQWEAVRAALMANGIESGAMIRPVKNPFLNADYLANVEAGGKPGHRPRRRRPARARPPPQGRRRHGRPPRPVHQARRPRSTSSATPPRAAPPSPSSRSSTACR